MQKHSKKDLPLQSLDKMFAPQSVALLGASDKPGSVGKIITDNMLGAGFKGPIFFVNPHHEEIDGQKCWPDIQSLPDAPDLAVIATPPSSIPGIIADLGRKGTRAAVIITAGISAETQAAINKAASDYDLRIIGPNCIGLMIPPLGLNAGFAHITPLPGDLGFISQSGAIIGAMLGWSMNRQIGFSNIISLGNMDDFDVGDALNYLAGNAGTQAILVYLEQITHADKFMKAAQVAARSKPVVVIKSGRHAEGAKAAASHTGALAGADAVYDAAFRRAGLIRVTDLEEFFDAAEILGRIRPSSCERLAIITNGGGAGVLAVDRLIDYGGKLATLADETLLKLDHVLPASWPRSNPVDIIGDAGPERYSRALDIVLADANVDAALVIYCPTGLASGEGAARAVIETIRQKKSSKPVLASWLGKSEAACSLLEKCNIPTFETPEDAVRSFTYLTKYARSQETLLHKHIAPSNLKAGSQLTRQIIALARKENRTLLTEAETKAILQERGIPVVSTIRAMTAGDVYQAAQKILEEADRVVVKILSREITHKSDAGGVALNIESAESAQKAAEQMQKLLGGKIEGFTVQRMITKPRAHELIVGLSHDVTFGPVILFGAGGTGVEVINDKAVALPPLDSTLARELIGETRIYKLLKGYRDRPGAALDDIARTLVQLSELTADVPEIRELDINPLLADENGVIALDARIILKSL